MVGGCRWGCPGRTSAALIAICWRLKRLWRGSMLSARDTPTGTLFRQLPKDVYRRNRKNVRYTNSFTVSLSS